MVTLLRCADGELQLSSDATGWCDVMVVISGHQHQLGADSVKVVHTRLSDGICKTLQGTPSGIIEGAEVRWVLSLAERHGSVYAADVEGRRVLFFQEANGGQLGKLSLSSEDRRKWCELLDQRGDG